MCTFIYKCLPVGVYILTSSLHRLCLCSSARTIPYCLEYPFSLLLFCGPLLVDEELACNVASLSPSLGSLGRFGLFFFSLSLPFLSLGKQQVEGITVWGLHVIG